MRPTPMSCVDHLPCSLCCGLRSFEGFAGRTLRVSIPNSSLRRITTSGVRVDDSPSSLNSSHTDTTSAWAPHVCNSACGESHCLLAGCSRADVNCAGFVNALRSRRSAYLLQLPFWHSYWLGRASQRTCRQLQESCDDTLHPSLHVIARRHIGCIRGCLCPEPLGV